MKSSVLIQPHPNKCNLKYVWWSPIRIETVHPAHSLRLGDGFLKHLQHSDLWMIFFSNTFTHIFRHRARSTYHHQQQQQQLPHFPHHRNHLPNILRHSALAGDVPLQFAFQAVRVVLLAAAALHLWHHGFEDGSGDHDGVGHDDGDHDHDNKHDHEIDGYVAHLPLLHIHLIFDLVGGSNRKTTRARDHVPLL